MSENQNNFETIFDVRYKDGKVDQVTITMGYKVNINYNYKILEQVLTNMKAIFKDVPMKQGTDVITVETFCDNAIERLKKAKDSLYNSDSNDTL